MTYDYQTQGTCSKMIHITADNGVLQEVQFVGGCPGNTQGISNLIKGMKVDEAISRLEGIRCGAKPTSCPDQLAQALKAMKNEE